MNLGAVEVISTTDTLQDFYNLSNQGAGSGFFGPRDLVRDLTTSLFFVAGSDGLGLFTVHGLGTRPIADGERGAANVSYEFSAQTSFVLQDGDPASPVANDAYFVDGAPETVTGTLAGTDFRAAQRYGLGATDGSVIGNFSTEKNVLEALELTIFVQFEPDLAEVARADDPNPFNLANFRIVGGLEGGVAQDVVLLSNDAERRVRLSFVPTPASLLLFGLGLAITAIAARRRDT